MGGGLGLDDLMCTVCMACKIDLVMFGAGLSEGATAQCVKLSCAALDSRLRDGTQREMYGGGNGHILAGTRYYPPHYPLGAPISSPITRAQRLSESRPPAWLFRRKACYGIGL